MEDNSNKSAVILGLGNDILSDDGVGIHAARESSNLLKRGENSNYKIDVVEASIAGIGLLDILDGYSRAVIIDAVQDPSKESGTVVHGTLEEFSSSYHLVAAHQIDLPTAVLLGEQVGVDLPKEIFVVGVVARDVSSFSEKCTPEVEAAILPAAELALKIAKQGRARGQPVLD